MPATTDHRKELAEFLRGRRETIRPDQVGLPVGRGRRTPGLRREEVAMLAGVSLTWYTWLEQGRRINASRDVLLAIGRALRLDEAGQEHLLSLTEPGTVGIDVPTTAPTALERLITALMPAPAYVLGPHWEFLAWNDAQERLYPAHRRTRTAAAQPAVGAVRRPGDARADRRLGHPRPPSARRVPVGHLDRSPRCRR